MMPRSAVRVACCWVVLQVCVLFPWTTCTDSPVGSGMQTGSFEGVESIRMVQCNGVGVDVDAVWIKESTEEDTLVTAGKDKVNDLMCTTSSAFAACSMQMGSKENISVKVILTDLRPGEDRVYTCVVRLKTSTINYEVTPFNITVSRPEVTSTSTVSTTTAVTENEPPKTEESSSSNTNNSSMFTASVVYVILALLILMATVCAVLAGFYCKNQRRKRRSRDCDVMSIRSGVTDKSFYAADPLTCRGGFVPNMSGTLPRPFAPDPPPPNKGGPSLVANRRVMHYQKPSDAVSMGGINPAADRSFMSESLVHYHEPWGGRVLDDPEILSQLSTLRSPNRSLVQVPYFDIASSRPSPSQAPPTFADTPPPVPEAPPPPSSAVSGDASDSVICPPTQEIGRHLGEESV